LVEKARELIDVDRAHVLDAAFTGSKRLSPVRANQRNQKNLSRLIVTG
jgi:hypothetical protein